MKQFIAKFGNQIQGTLSGFDRVVFRGSLRRLTHSQGMKMYLIQNGILCKEYQDHVKKVSQNLKQPRWNPFVSNSCRFSISTVPRPTRSRSRVPSRRSETSGKGTYPR